MLFKIPKNPFHLAVEVSYSLGDLEFKYNRPYDPEARFNRAIWVPGRLAKRNAAGWNTSFFVPKGYYILAAAPGRTLYVIDGKSRKHRVMPGGTRGLFRVVPGVQEFEVHTPEFRLEK